ncbi:MAG: family 10 glycosylhydrolase [Candidatus Latescibacteria bacterium]|nr:family 10 glycosylhydrolase [Candidatus Latescibacterota bacterium]
MARKIKNWTWINTQVGLADVEWRTRFEHMRQAGINAILPEVFNNHHAAYNSAHLPVEGPWLEQILPLAQEAGLEVHAWMHTMTCNIPRIGQEHPEWFAVNGRGESAVDKPAYVGYYKFLCPSRPEVAQFLCQRVAELASYPGLTSVHLDYIRLPDVILAAALQPQYDIVQDREYPQYDYCYCSVCRQLFKEQSGIDIDEVEDAAAEPAWRQFRCDQISALVKEQLAPTARKLGKAVTAAVFPNWHHVRQQWSTWDIDGVLPMLYHSFYEEELNWIGAQCARGVAALPAGLPLYSGLFVPALSPAELIQACQISLDSGAQGVSLFAAGSMSPEHWAAFANFNNAGN